MAQTILFLAANPLSTDRLRLDKEISEIAEGLRRAKQRDKFKLEQSWAVNADGLRRAILDHEPTIVHFSGHGTGDDGIVLEDSVGMPTLVSTDALEGLFALFPSIECVVLNACYSQVQAEAIAKHVNYVIGMAQQIGDESAKKFAVGFYDALGANKSIEFAYKLGCNAIHLTGAPEHLMPTLLVRPGAQTEKNQPEEKQSAGNQAEVMPTDSPIEYKRYAPIMIGIALLLLIVVGASQLISYLPISATNNTGAVPVTTLIAAPTLPPSPSPTSLPTLSFHDWESSWDTQWEFEGKWDGGLMTLNANQSGINGKYPKGELSGSFTDSSFTKVTGIFTNTPGNGVTCSSGYEQGSFTFNLTNNGQHIDGLWDICSAGTRRQWKADKRD